MVARRGKVASQLSGSEPLRKIVLSLMARINVGDVTIRHHWTGDPIAVHSFRHRGYWFFGAARERETLLSCARLIKHTDVVFDVGAHIGYTAVYFARLASEGAVHAFEPSPANLTYLRRNVRTASNVVVVPAAAGNVAGEADMWEDSLSGQNSTLLPDLMSLPQTERHVHVRSRTVWVRVPVVRLDDYVDAAGLFPDFVKMDVEGFELEALTGATRVLRAASPKLMVEITRNAEDVAQHLTRMGYCPFDATLQPLEWLVPKPRNTFFLHRDAHSGIIERLRA